MILDVILPSCHDCKHLTKADDGLFICDAFPYGIPNQILDGEVSHKTPISGQNNSIVYEPYDPTTD